MVGVVSAPPSVKSAPFAEFPPSVLIPSLSVPELAALPLSPVTEFDAPF